MRSLLFILIYFVAITALSSGLILILKPDGSSLGLNLSILRDTPFHNFFIPGLLLLFIIGGIHLIVILLRIFHHPQTYKYCLIASLALVVWMVLQFLLLHWYTWLNGFYLGMGVLIGLMSIQQMKKAAF